MRLEVQEIKCCVICGSDSYTKLLSSDKFKMGLTTVYCNKCGFVFTNPMPSEGYLDYFYKKVYRKFYTSYSEPSETYIKNLGRDKRAAYHASFLDQGGYLQVLDRYIDVGAAEGSFLKALKDLAPDQRRECVGVEPNVSFSNFALNAGFYDHHVGSIHELKNCDGSALVSMIHVLEHIRNPTEFLVQLRDILGPNGVLFLDVPDISEYKSISEIHIAHLYHFDVDSLKNLLFQAGYKVLIIEAHEPPHHPKSIRAVAKPLASKEDLKASIILNSDERISLVKESFARIKNSERSFFSIRAKLQRFAKRILGPVKRSLT